MILIWKWKKTMQLVLVADRDEGTRRMIAESLRGGDFQIVEADTIDAVLRDVLKNKAQIILLGSDFDGLKAMEIIPLLKQCNRDLIIILVSNEESLALLRRLRREGIFYHALKPVSSDDQAELMQVIKCAFHNAQER
jgi:DNA-binding NtrC family response regulator